MKCRLFLLCIFTLALCSPSFGDGVAGSVTSLHFAVDVDNGTPFGLSQSGVSIEDAADACQDDFYQYPAPAPGPPVYNIETIDEGVPGLQLGTGAGVITNALCFGTSTLDLLVIEELPESLGILFAIQFTVSSGAIGMPGTDVNLEATASPPESGGDVFQCSTAGSNKQIADETAIGLQFSPENDINALVVNETLPAVSVDTDGVSGPDSPMVYFSVKNSAGAPTALSSDDIGMTAAFGAYPVYWKNATELGLAGGGTPNMDDIDALFIDATGDVFFSLAAGSPMLSGIAGSTGLPIINAFSISGTGADPGDIIAVTPGTGGAPFSPPIVVIPAAALGLVGDLIPNPGIGEDDLNGLHMTIEELAAENWDLY